MIPVYEPILDGNEKKYLCRAIDQGEVSSAGRFVHLFEEAFARWAGTRYAVAVNSGTSALETAIFSLRMRNINIPVGTIISCFISAVRIGCDITFRDLGDKRHYPMAMRVHLFGDLDRSTADVCVDDCSQYWDKFDHQDASCYSLYANKTITAGEGGVIATNCYTVYNNAMSYRNLAHSAERFIHESRGYNFRMSNLQGAVALAQLEQIDRFIEIKQKNRDLYLKYLPDEVTQMFKVNVPWMYLVGTEYDAGRIVNSLAVKAIQCRRFFYPLNRQPCINSSYLETAFPKADSLRSHAFYLPSGLTLTDKEIKRVCKTLGDTLKSMKTSTKKSRIRKKLSSSTTGRKSRKQ